MKDDSVAEDDAFALLQREAAVLALPEAADAKGVGGKQAISPHVPRRGMTEALRMIQDRDANGFTIHRPVVIHPRGALAPRCLISDAVGVDGNLEKSGGETES